MVSKKQFYKDMDIIAEATNSVYFNYVDLTTKNLNPGREYNLKDFYGKCKKLLGDDYKKILSDSQIVKIENDITKYIKCGSAEGGGGVNYNFGQKGNIFFFYNDSTQSQKHTGYHEAAHSLQKQQNLFDDNGLDKVYEFLSRGVKNFDENSPLAKEMVNATTYKKYLKEAHADAFATACLLLGSKNKIQYKIEQVRGMIEGCIGNYRALKTKNKEYPSFKYYSSLPTQIGIIDAINDCLKSGKLDRLYKPNGEIDFFKLSKETEKVVLDKAYNPKEFKKILDKDIIGKKISMKENPTRKLFFSTLKVINTTRVVSNNIRIAALKTRQIYAVISTSLKAYIKQKREEKKRELAAANANIDVPIAVKGKTVIRGKIADLKDRLKDKNEATSSQENKTKEDVAISSEQQKVKNIPNVAKERD